MRAFWWALLASALWGITSVIEKFALGRAEPLPGLFYRCIGAILGLFVLGLFVLKPDQIRSVDPRSGIFLVVSGFIGSFLAFIAFYHALKVGEVSLVVPVASSFFLVAFVLGVVFFGEALTLVKVTAVVLLVAGFWLLKTAF